MILEKARFVLGQIAHGMIRPQKEINEAVDTVFGELDKRKWIPVTERLPEDYGTYICTCFDGCANRVTFVKWQNKLKQWILNGSRSYWKVIAWMPLPEPYCGAKMEETNG